MASQDIASHMLRLLGPNDTIEPSVKAFFLSRNGGILYGAGTQARHALMFSALFAKPVRCLLVSPGGRDRLGGHDHPPVYAADAVPPSIDKKMDVLIAVDPRWNGQISATLRNNGFPSIFRADDWRAANRAISNLAFPGYLECYGFTRTADAKGETRVQADFAGGVFTLPFPECDRVFLTDVAGEFHDIVLPSIFGNLDLLIDGPYECGDVALRGGDVVFDLGANMGLFTAAAAARDCRVYAFEPAPYTLERLKRTASLYRGVTVCPYAVADVNKKVAFSVNADLESVLSTVGNTLRPVKVKGFVTIEVDAVSIDEFVERNGIGRVDFIKADIEGAERLMLAGAKKTLARFAPKLALCTYHLPDDPEVMERLILEANPGYTIEHKWSKLYAYCRP
ncbi:MAG: FkbM family methyltransferase [Planctomycetota bacterium]|jgi:FkbM family methyltransferase|nr:FkbM family methyltransferase [Planctomycetota bacterium]